MRKRNVRHLVAILLVLALLPLGGTAMADITCEGCGESIPHYVLKGYASEDSTYHLEILGCTKCDYTYTRRTWHSDKQYFPGADSTCTTQGWYRYWVCGKCGHEEKQMKPLSPHTYQSNSFVYNNDATCYQDGTRTGKCIWYGINGCEGTWTKTASGTKVPHDFMNVPFIPYRAATCTRNASSIAKCAFYDGQNCKMELVREEQGTKLGHDYAGQEYLPYTEATCTRNATERAQCVRFGKDGCQACDVREIPDTASGHDLVRHEAKAATCTEAGWEAYESCRNCEYTTYVEIPAQHDLVYHEAKAATCTEAGWEAYESCRNCEYTTYVEIPAAHDLTQHPAKAVTCTEAGWEAYETCSKCDYSTYAEIPAPGHDLARHPAKAATCTEAGWDAYETCSRCDYTTYREIPPLNHDWSDWTFNGDLTHSRVCNNDPSHVETEACDMWPASCTWRARCSVCWGRYGEPDPNNHDWLNNWRSNGDGTHYSTCNHNVLHVRTEPCSGSDAACGELGQCSVCRSEYTVLHDYGDWETDADTHLQRCRRCQATGNQGAHSYEAKADQRYLATPATCVAPATYYLSCSLCGKASTTAVELGEKDANGHDLEHHDAKAATCTEIGWEAYDTCKNCDYTTYVEIPASGHDLEHHEAKAATCTEIGWEAYDTCKKCDYTTYVELPALGHDYQKTVVKPTCEKDGCTRYTCTRCQDTYTENSVKKLYHWFGEWAPNGDGTHSANCLRKGCKHMGKTDCQKFEFIAAENESLIFCPVCGEVENGTRLEQIEKTMAVAETGKLPAGELIARMNEAYLSLAFEYAGKITEPTGQVKITLPAELLAGKTLTRIALDGTETEVAFEIDGEEASFTLDFTEDEMPVILIRLTDAA